MMMKYALCSIALAALVSPALAAKEYYVVHNTTTKDCYVAEQKPTADSFTVIGTSYDALAKAEEAMKANKICSTK